MGPLCGLKADRGDFANFCGVVVGHAVKEEGGVPGVGRFHLVPYGVLIMGAWRADGPCGYGGGPAPVCCPCLSDGACGWLEGCGGVRWSAWKPLEAFKTNLWYCGRLWWDRERALVAGDAYHGGWTRCVCNLGGRVVSAG